MKEGLSLIETTGGDSEKEKREDGFDNLIKLRNAWYEKDIAQNPEAEKNLPALRRHNEVVQQFGKRLISLFRKKGELSELQADITKIAIDLHDCGKLGVPLLEHHEKGMERAKIILEEFQKENGKIEGVDFSGVVEVGDKKINIQEKILQAINRHMNHPYLVKSNNKNRFPEPEDLIDKIVFDADMLANIGFKNISFRLNSRKNKEEDQSGARKERIPYIQQVFKSVVDEAEELPGVMTCKEAAELGGNLVKKVRVIYEGLGFGKIQEKIDQKKMSTEQIIDFLNQKIKKTAKEIDGQEAQAKNFLIS